MAVPSSNHLCDIFAADHIPQECQSEVLQTTFGSQRKIWAQAHLGWFTWVGTRFACPDVLK